MAAQAGSKRRRKDPQEDAAQAESVNCLSQRLAEMPSPLNFKRVRTGNAVEAMDPMEGVDGDVHDGQGIWEQQNRSDVSNHFTQGSVMSQVCVFSKHALIWKYDIVNFENNRVIFKSMGTLSGVGAFVCTLLVLHTISIISFHLWCMLGGSVWIWMKSNLFRFVEG